MNFEMLVLDPGKKTRCENALSLLFALRSFSRLWKSPQLTENDHTIRDTNTRRGGVIAAVLPLKHHLRKNMYQIEVKRYLVEHIFPTEDGWHVTIDVDAMEMGLGNQNSQQKRDIATQCDAWLRANGVTIGAHELHGRIDLAAERNGRHYLIEVEGDSSRQKEQAFYSAIGQTLLLMNAEPKNTIYGVAVPDSPQWQRQIDKLPGYVRELLRMNLYMVGPDSVRTIAFTPSVNVAEPIRI